MKKRYLQAFISAFVLSLLLSIIIFNHLPLTAQSDSTILVSAAASLKDVLEEIAPLFEKANPSITANYNFGASGALQQQIAQGAPTDVFISAAKKQMDALQDMGLIINETRQNLLTNRLVLIVPSNSSLKITDFRSLTNPDVKKIAVGEPRSVPVGQYSEEVFTKLGILSQIKPKLVYSNSVRSVLAAVESGNADAGIVYITDAKISDKVKIVATASNNLHSPIVYPIAVIRASKNPRSARTYLRYLTTATAKTLFQKYGFGLSL